MKLWCHFCWYQPTSFICSSYFEVTCLLISASHRNDWISPTAFLFFPHPDIRTVQITMFYTKKVLKTDLIPEMHTDKDTQAYFYWLPHPAGCQAWDQGAEALASRPAPLRLIMFTLPAVTHFLSAWKAHSLQAPPWLLLSLTTSPSKQSLLARDIWQPCQGWLIKMTDCEQLWMWSVVVFKLKLTLSAAVCCLSFGIQLVCVSVSENASFAARLFPTACLLRSEDLRSGIRRFLSVPFPSFVTAHSCQYSLFLNGWECREVNVIPIELYITCMGNLAPQQKPLRDHLVYSL